VAAGAEGAGNAEGTGGTEVTEDWDIVAQASTQDGEESDTPRVPNPPVGPPAGAGLEESSVLVEADFGKTEADADDPDDGWDEARREA